MAFMKMIVLRPGHPSGLVVVPNGQKFVAEQPTVLKLKEKFWSWSGDDCTIKESKNSFTRKDKIRNVIART